LERLPETDQSPSEEPWDRGVDSVAVTGYPVETGSGDLGHEAVVMTACGDFETAAVFWGAVTDGVLARLAALPPNEIPGHKQMMAAVQSELGDDRYSSITARGEAMTDEQMTVFARAAVEDPRQN
jgi:hypothetical protein